MANYLELSHRIDFRTPLASGVPPFKFEHHCSITRGDDANMFMLHFSNHTGTHMDAPWHVVASGLRIGELPLEDFVFERPACLDVSLHEGEMLEPVHLEPHGELLGQCDLLLLRTGFSVMRKEDPQRYAMQSPGVSIAAAAHLAANFPKLRAIGLDTISIACMQHLDQGLEAHRTLLSGEGRRFLIIEDMNLQYDLSRLNRVIALPLFIEGIDSAPCTVIGVIG
jgi:kynurenine formamidase